MESNHDHESLIEQSQNSVQETQKLVTLGTVSVQEMKTMIRNTQEAVRRSQERLQENPVGQTANNE